MSLMSNELTEIQEKVLRVALLRADVVWSLEWVSDEEDGPVETDEVIVTFLSESDEDNSKSWGLTSV